MINTIMLIALILIPQIAYSEDFWVKINKNIPALNEEQSLFLGDRMIYHATGYQVPCYKSKIDFTKKNIVGALFHIKSGGEICEAVPTNKDPWIAKSWHSRYINVTGSGKSYFMDIVLKFKKKSVIYKAVTGWTIKKFSLEEFENSFEKTIGMVIYEDSLQREIEYAGKSGNTLRFIYSEFKDDTARAAFTREFSLDLDEGNVGAYKGAVFEVINADNATITYKILRYFHD